MNNNLLGLFFSTFVSCFWGVDVHNVNNILIKSNRLESLQVHIKINYAQRFFLDLFEFRMLFNIFIYFIILYLPPNTGRAGGGTGPQRSNN